MNIWPISTTAHFDGMRTAFPCLIAEVTNDSVFFKQTKAVHLVPLCIWFAFYSMLFFSPQGNFCMFYLFKLSGVTEGKISEKILQSEEVWVFQSLPLKISKAEQSVRLFLHYSLKVFQAKIKKNPFFHFPFNSTEHSYTCYSTEFIVFQ